MSHFTQNHSLEETLRMRQAWEARRRRATLAMTACILAAAAVFLAGIQTRSLVAYIVMAVAIGGSVKFWTDRVEANVGLDIGAAMIAEHLAEQSGMEGPLTRVEREMRRSLGLADRESDDEQ